GRWETDPEPGHPSEGKSKPIPGETILHNRLRTVRQHEHPAPLVAWHERDDEVFASPAHILRLSSDSGREACQLAASDFLHPETCSTKSERGEDLVRLKSAQPWPMHAALRLLRYGARSPVQCSGA